MPRTWEDRSRQNPPVMLLCYFFMTIDSVTPTCSHATARFHRTKVAHYFQGHPILFWGWRFLYHLAWCGGDVPAVFLLSDSHCFLLLQRILWGRTAVCLTRSPWLQGIRAVSRIDPLWTKLLGGHAHTRGLVSTEVHISKGSVQGVQLLLRCVVISVWKGFLYKELLSSFQSHCRLLYFHQLSFHAIASIT